MILHDHDAYRLNQAVDRYAERAGVCIGSFPGAKFIAERKSLSRFRLPLSNIVAPFAQGFDDLRKNSCRKRYANEDEGFVNKVCEAKLSPDR